MHALVQGRGVGYELIQQFSGTFGVCADSVGASLADFHTSGGQFNERLEKNGGRAGASGRVPERLPGLVRLPIKSMIKKVDPMPE